MQRSLLFLAAIAMAAILTGGCAHTAKTEKKFGRGLNNSFDIVRGGEFRRTMEQTALFDSPDTA